MIALSGMLLISPAVQAECEDVISRCDVVIEKQSKLIDRLGIEYETLSDEHARLLREYEAVRVQYERDKQNTYFYGAIGIALGVLLGVAAQ